MNQRPLIDATRFLIRALQPGRFPVKIADLRFHAGGNVKAQHTLGALTLSRGQKPMQFCDFALSRRFERAEGHSCVRFAEARRRLFPDSGAEWMECSGAYAIFDGVRSPVTQTFGLGIFEELTVASLEVIERFFLDRGADVDHEVSPLVGVAALDLLCSRRYRPIEISNVLYRSLEEITASHGQSDIRVRVAGSEEAELWSDTSTKAWTHDHPEYLEFFRGIAAVFPARDDSVSFLAEINGQVGAAASLSIHQGVAVLSGAATIPAMRRRGLQAALLHERQRYAFDHGCDLAMMVAGAGSDPSATPSGKVSRLHTRASSGAWVVSEPGSSRKSAIDRWLMPRGF